MTIKGYRIAVLPPQSATITAPRFNVGSIDNVGVHLVDDSGVEGFGYAYVFDSHSAKAVAELIEGFADVYVGTEPYELRRARSTLLVKRVNFLGLRGLARLAAAALDMAAWDLLCKLHDTNLMGMVGLERTEVPGFTAAGLWSGLSPEVCARIAPQVAEEYHSPHVKMWLGSSDLGFEAERVRRGTTGARSGRRAHHRRRTGLRLADGVPAGRAGGGPRHLVVRGSRRVRGPRRPRRVG